MLPGSAAFDFLLYCQRNQKPCPLLEVVEAGGVAARRLAPGSDLRRDLPRYRVFRDGKPAEEPQDVTGLWRNDFVSFLPGCSFSFERPLLDAGLALAITHAPGHMFVSDLREQELRFLHGSVR